MIVMYIVQDIFMLSSWYNLVTRIGSMEEVCFNLAAVARLSKIP